MKKEKAKGKSKSIAKKERERDVTSLMMCRMCSIKSGKS